MTYVVLEPTRVGILFVPPTILYCGAKIADKCKGIVEHVNETVGVEVDRFYYSARWAISQAADAR